MLLEKLSNAFGVSGCETDVRAILKEELTPHVNSVLVDTLGNLLVHKKGAADGLTVLISAHMDEVGMMVADIEQNGLLKFYKVGGIDDRVLTSKLVEVGPDKVKGVIGAKAVHQQKADERDKTLTSEQLYIDIGAGSEEEAKKLVNTGDYIAFSAKAKPFGQNCFMGKALDNRLGCYILAELLKLDLPISIWGVFTVQEEVGLRGSGVAAYQVKPDLALVVETTTAADVADTKEHRQATTLGKGPVVTFMDQSFAAHKGVFDFIIQTAEDNKMPYQFRRFTGAGTDAGRISQTGAGVPTGVISTPCRYLHGPRSVINLDDAKKVQELFMALLKSLATGGYEKWKNS